MNNFHDVSFPHYLAFGASGGPERKVEVTQLSSGAETRNLRHAKSRRRYNAVLGIKTYQQAIDIISFFESRLGRLHAFRFKDKVDCSSADHGSHVTETDQIIGIGDGSETSFQLVKTYSDLAGEYKRHISKPVTGTVTMAVNGTVVSSLDIAIDYLSGVITFTTPPSSGDVITAGFEFDVPVRFDMDRLDVTLDDFEAVQITDVPLIEVLDYV